MQAHLLRRIGFAAGGRAPLRTAGEFQLLMKIVKLHYEPTMAEALLVSQREAFRQRLTTTPNGSKLLVRGDPVPMRGAP